MCVLVNNATTLFKHMLLYYKYRAWCVDRKCRWSIRHVWSSTYVRLYLVIHRRILHTKHGNCFWLMLLLLFLSLKRQPCSMSSARGAFTIAVTRCAPQHHRRRASRHHLARVWDIIYIDRVLPRVAGLFFFFFLLESNFSLSTLGDYSRSRRHRTHDDTVNGFLIHPLPVHARRRLAKHYGIYLYESLVVVVSAAAVGLWVLSFQLLLISPCSGLVWGWCHVQRDRVVWRSGFYGGICRPRSFGVCVCVC